jgi:hypothetical protein
MAGVDRRQGVAATARFLRETIFQKGEREVSESERRENEGIKNMKKMLYISYNTTVGFCKIKHWFRAFPLGSI